MEVFKITLNPIKAISEQLEKLIIEHGSATVRGDHITFLKEQLVVLKDQFAILEKENSVLKEKIKDFVMELEGAKEEIANLQQIIEAKDKTIEGYYQKKANTSQKYDETTTEILKLLFYAGRELTLFDFLNVFPLQVNIIQYHFDILLKDRLIIQTQAAFDSSWTRTNKPAKYSITSEGRKYVVENKLI